MHKYFIEFVGTLLLLFVILTTGNPIAIGATLCTVILFGGKISGAHFNPAVSIAMASKGAMNVSDLIPYILSQMAGGLVALELVRRYM